LAGFHLQHPQAITVGMERVAVEKALVPGAQLIEDRIWAYLHRGHTTIPWGPAR
jgi:hypothetical protein